MNLFIVVLLMNCVHLFGDNFSYRLTKTNLRGMYKNELERIMNEWFISSFNSVFNNIVSTAKSGKNEYKFALICNNEGSCRSFDIHNIWLPEIDSSIINIKNYTTNLINALHTTFSDSNFTVKYKKCCEYYKIEW